jgi:hypothetical protein
MNRPRRAALTVLIALVGSGNGLMTVSALSRIVSL